MNMDRIYQKAMEEHREINVQIRRLKDKIRCGQGQPSNQEELRDLVSELRSHLKEHFKIEEEGGFMTPVLEERPQAESVVLHLKKEHEEILDQCDDIIQTLTSGSTSPEKLEGVCETIKNLIQQLGSHEKQEDDLIQTVFVDEIGTKD
ncbi:MAG: hemerythrin domain-containing protein [bacterium]|jgi:iron-sulfur cluster repair protein YtfE (RIC family)|nr:hemerythrin domain-containing protein [bacterium]